MHGAGGGRPIKHGRYSKALQRSTLVAHYDEAVEDKSLFDLKEPIALLEACLRRTSERVADRDTPEFRKRCLELYEAAQQSLKDGDSAGASSRLKDLGQLIRQGTSEDRAIADLRYYADNLAARIEGAWRIHLSSGQSYNRQALVKIMAQILEFIRIEAGRTAAQRVQSRLVNLLSASDGGNLKEIDIGSGDEPEET
jgi:hypothetical protein